MQYPSVITLDRLSKRYHGSDRMAVRDISLHIQPGEIYGFLGPNGAGKSTTIRVLMNFIRPTNGSASILGLDAQKDTVTIKRSIGYLASDMAMYPKMTGAQFLRYLSELHGSHDPAYQHALIRTLKAEPAQQLGNLSRGNRQKFAIIQAFMHRPQVLILDEPSSGLDPLMQEAFYALLHEAKDRGAAVFMSSHIMSEVQKVCDKVGIIRDGQLIAERDIAEMVQEAAHTLDITFKGTPPLPALKRLRGVAVTAHDARHVTIRLRGELPPLLAVLAKQDVVQLDVHQLDLEELFIHYYKNEESR